VLANFLSYRPRHATVVAYLALFVALGGTSYAAVVVTGANVKDGSLTGVDVRDRSLFAKDLSKSTVKSLAGARGPQGAAGAQGPQGPQGPAGTPAPTDAITGANVVNESLTTADLAGSQVNGAISLSGIANGRCTQVTFNIGGAEVGDSTIVSTRAAIQNGIVLYANRVASEGHVEVNACNFSGTTMTAISGFPIRVITFR
jgi:hypothetical protein